MCASYIDLYIPHTRIPQLSILYTKIITVTITTVNSNSDNDNNKYVISGIATTFLFMEEWVYFQLIYLD